MARQERSIEILVDYDEQTAEGEIVDTRYPENYSMYVRKLTDDEIAEAEEDDEATEARFTIEDNSLDSQPSAGYPTFQAALSAMIASLAETLDISLQNDQDIAREEDEAE